jgi:predicted amidohydrolase YtcJ
MPEASLLLKNANVATLASRRPRAQAIAVKDGKIIGVGSNREICMHLGKKTKIIDCRGKTILPGFVDCHVHMKDFGLFLQQVDLRNAKSIEEMQKILSQHVEKHPEQLWITGGRWDQEKLKEKRYPTRWDLDPAISNKPALLNRVCGHLAVVNSKALCLAGVTKHTKIRGGEVELDRNTGQPNGILKDNAIDLVWKIIPRLGKKAAKEACVLACKKAVEAGLTGVHWLVSSSEEINILQKMCEDRTLPLRIYLGIPKRLLDHVLALGMSSGFGNEMLKIGFIKILSDGSLGAQTAAMKRPYSDNPRRRGIMLYSQRDLRKIVMKAHMHGWQLGIHAIGDRAMENVLDAYEEALKKAPNQNHRHRIEHCSILNQKLITRMRKLGIVASVQPHFAISDFWTVDRVGPERAQLAYPFKTLIEKGVMVASGSDCPVERINPLLGVWAAVTRKDNVKESLSVEEALKTYTSNAAYASFDEDKKGTIENGKFADLTVLSDDPTKIPPDKIRDISVEMVIVNGKVAYSKEQSKH